MLRVNSPGTISSGPVLSYPVQQTDVTSIRGPLPKPFVQSTGYSQSGSANTVAPEYFDTDERFFQSNSNVKGSNIDSSKSAVSTPRQMISTPEFKPESTASFDSTDQRRPSVGRSPPSFTSENIRIVYEKFRGIINPKNSKGAAQDSGSSAEVSGILGKKIIDR